MPVCRTGRMWDLCSREWTRLVSALAAGAMALAWMWGRGAAKPYLLFCETLYVSCPRDCHWGLNMSPTFPYSSLQVKLGIISDGEPRLWSFAWRWVQEIQTSCFLLGVGLGWGVSITVLWKKLQLSVLNYKLLGTLEVKTRSLTSIKSINPSCEFSSGKTIIIVIIIFRKLIRNANYVIFLLKAIFKLS